ncbi:MAG: tRNA (adenosine(37)-N6)-threonylcarbamoyltransferase complex transferase subunit TsaD [Thermoleophilia bacterium]|nr:tRNA (adenosine(37)-N6)-threonylcarbamoyltransferase complex transferase subunit TsaD [Thermoleophilia bacterium]
MPKPFVIREMDASDLPSVIAIENASFPSPWSREMLAGEVGQRLGWSKVAVEPGAGIVGFIVGRRYPDVWHVMDLAVAPGRRRRGVGGRLLAGFLEAADLAGMEVVLEVRRGNRAAAALYGARGFEVIAVRRDYYTDSGEDALVMSRPVGAGRAEARLAGLHGPLLAIESSCDDSAAAVLSSTGEVLASVAHSQDAIHERYGGVVPEVASRAHVERMTAVVREALRQAGCRSGDLGGVAVTVGPGLIGALLVGVQTAKAIAWCRQLPFFPVNHIHGHLAAAWLTDPEAPLPMVSLVASGGHTMLIRVDDRNSFQLLGQTLDDAAGEAFDKGARLLGLGYPGGRELDELAERGDPDAFSFPIGLKRSVKPDFSFSGVKTALYYLLRDMTPDERALKAADIAASYRKAIVDALVGKAIGAAERERVSTLAVAGGVAANSLLRRRLVQAGTAAGLRVVIPDLKYCTDNAAMIGAAALGGPRLEYPSYLSVDASASLALGRWLPADGADAVSKT